MSTHLHCDGPSCDKTNKPTDPDAEYPPSGWLRLLDQRAYVAKPIQRDFCSARCVYDWSYIQSHPDAGK